MTQDIRDVLKLALEALEANYLLVNGTETHGGLEQCLDGYYSGCFDTDPINKKTDKAITAIKEALAQPVQCKYPDCNYPCLIAWSKSLWQMTFLGRLLIKTQSLFRHHSAHG